jgi:glyoxylase-like metal-dependent hydrolase (beta-lactamase superfamily II)
VGRLYPFFIIAAVKLCGPRVAPPRAADLRADYNHRRCLYSEFAMSARTFLAASCVVTVAALAWFTGAEPTAQLKRWEKVGDGVYRTKDGPYSYAVVSGDRAILIDATVPPDAVTELGVKTVEAVLLTHHHRDTAAFAGEYRKKGVPVRAAKESADYLKPEGVAKFWKEAVPLRNSRTAYFVLPEGVEDVDCTLADNANISFGTWGVTAVATPGHSRDHFAFLVQPVKDVKGPRYLFAGDALHSRGKLWTPYTTDWDHWTDVGLKPAAESLRKLGKLNANVLLPAHGAVVTEDVAKTLTDTAAAVEEAGFMKSYERFTKQRLKDEPKYDFLIPKEQIASAGDKPWAKVAEKLWITGNTYVLQSKTGDGIFVLDPWGQRSADQVAKLQKDEKLGPVELVAFSHAHYDHFDGIHVLPDRDKCEVWSLDLVAAPLKDPNRYRAPFLDPRPITFTKELKDGESAAWGGYQFKFHHLPGQSYFTSAIEVTLDGKRCLFTADNFFHQDQFSGTGGWMGLNRSYPAVYGTSAKKVLDLAPERVLAEHGGPYVFSAEDYRRRVRWGAEAAKAADALCLSGNHQWDWNPNRVEFEPHLQSARPGDKLKAVLRLNNASGRGQTVTAAVRGRGVVPDSTHTLTAAAGTSKEIALDVAVSATAKPGRYVIELRTTDASGVEGCDCFFAVDVSP